MARDARGLPEPLWKEISALGWPGLLIPSSLGGSDGTLLDVILLVEEMGRVCFPGPFVQSAVVATSLIREMGSRGQQERLLPAMALGDRITVPALLEESGTFDPDGITMPGDAGRLLQGRKLFVKDAHLAHDLIVVTRGGGGLTLFVIEADRPGITLSPMPAMSGDKLFEVAFDGVAVRDTDGLGAPGHGEAGLRTALDAGALARAAEMVGAAAHVLDVCVEHARTRVQSGRPIGAFQAIQHHLADMLRHVDAARFLLYRAAWQMQERRSSATDVAMAKAYAGDACLAVARRGHQVLGAIGYCEEHPMHLFHKRIHAASLDCGDAALHLETVARGIGLDPASRAGRR
jgi:alkylation response protein AidB-like acyl-CoA dehydrogenase